jgi:hypothetical protein
MTHAPIPTTYRTIKLRLRVRLLTPFDTAVRTLVRLMRMRIRTFSGRLHRSPARIALLAVLGLTFIAATAPSARATVRVVNHDDPAGDPTAITYRLSSTLQPLVVPDFALVDGEYRSFGLNPGTYTVQALVPAGWQVGDIQCVGPNPSEFTIDVANGRVTMVHNQGAEQTCSFTTRRVPASGGQAPPSSGVSPSVPTSEQSKVALPKGPALLRVRTGRGFASATVRIARRSVIRCSLVSGTRVVGTKRVVHKAGTYVVRVALNPRSRRQLRARGLKQTTLTLRVAVVAGKATHVFRFRALVRL